MNLLKSLMGRKERKLTRPEEEALYFKYPAPVVTISPRRAGGWWHLGWSASNQPEGTRLLFRQFRRNHKGNPYEERVWDGVSPIDTSLANDGWIMLRFWYEDDEGNTSPEREEFFPLDEEKVAEKHAPDPMEEMATAVEEIEGLQKENKRLREDRDAAVKVLGERNNQLLLVKEENKQLLKERDMQGVSPLEQRVQELSDEIVDLRDEIDTERQLVRRLGDDLAIIKDVAPAHPDNFPDNGPGAEESEDTEYSITLESEDTKVFENIPDVHGFGINVPRDESKMEVVSLLRHNEKEQKNGDKELQFGIKFTREFSDAWASDVSMTEIGSVKVMTYDPEGAPVPMLQDRLGCAWMNKYRTKGENITGFGGAVLFPAGKDIPEYVEIKVMVCKGSRDFASGQEYSETPNDNYHQFKLKIPVPRHWVTKRIDTVADESPSPSDLKTDLLDEIQLRESEFRNEGDDHSARKWHQVYRLVQGLASTHTRQSLEEWMRRAVKRNWEPACTTLPKVLDYLDRYPAA